MRKRTNVWELCVQSKCELWNCMQVMAFEEIEFAYFVKLIDKLVTNDNLNM